MRLRQARSCLRPRLGGQGCAPASRGSLGEGRRRWLYRLEVPGGPAGCGWPTGRSCALDGVLGGGVQLVQHAGVRPVLYFCVCLASSGGCSKPALQKGIQSWCHHSSRLPGGKWSQDSHRGPLGSGCGVKAPTVVLCVPRTTIANPFGLGQVRSQASGGIVVGFEKKGVSEDEVVEVRALHDGTNGVDANC